MLGLVLLALAAALYWVDRKMMGKAGGHLGEWLPSGMPGRAGREAETGTAPAGAAPMPGAAGADDNASGAFGLRAEAAQAEVTEAAAQTISTPPAAEVEETGEAPEPAEWQEALEGQAPETGAEGEGEKGSRKRHLVPSTATGWVEGDGTNVCPEGYPIKGKANSRIFHRPGESTYEVTIAAFCFATEEDAVSAGYRPRKR
jgi:hypothetical protein